MIHWNVATIGKDEDDVKYYMFKFFYRNSLKKQIINVLKKKMKYQFIEDQKILVKKLLKEICYLSKQKLMYKKKKKKEKKNH